MNHLRPYPTSRGRMAWIIAALAVISIVPFVQTLNHGFVDYDDMMYVYENDIVLRGWTWDGLRYAFTTIEGGNWHPLTWLAHMLDVQIWGEWPGGHHVASVILHAINTVLLFLIFTTMTRFVWRSAFVAALFAVHPMHVESVAWASERKDVLSACLGLLAIWMYVGYARAGSVARYAAMMVLFTLSLLTKPMLVTLPCLLLLLDVWPLQRLKALDIGVDAESQAVPTQRPMRLIIEKLPLFGIAAVFSLIAVLSQHAKNTDAPVDLLPISARVANAIVAYQSYVVKSVFPVNLAVFYPHPIAWDWRIVATSAVVLAAITVVAVMHRHSRPWLLIGWLWFLGLLVPVIGLVQVGYQFMADRYSYLPSVGLFVMACWSIPTFRVHFARWIIAGAGVFLTLTLMVVSFVQASTWRDSRTLFSHAIAVTEGNYVAHFNLANTMEAEGQLAEALDHYQMSAAIRPKNPAVWLNIGNVLIQMGFFAEAVEPLQISLELDRNSAPACNSLGMAMYAMGRNSDALHWLQQAVGIDPDHLESRGNYGAVLLQSSRPSEAIPHLEFVSTRMRLRVGVRTNLAKAYAAVGRIDDARAELRSILNAAPGYEPALRLVDELNRTKPIEPSATPSDSSPSPG